MLKYCYEIPDIQLAYNGWTYVMKEYKFRDNEEALNTMRSLDHILQEFDTSWYGFGDWNYSGIPHIKDDGSQGKKIYSIDQTQNKMNGLTITFVLSPYLLPWLSEWSKNKRVKNGKSTS